VSELGHFSPVSFAALLATVEQAPADELPALIGALEAAKATLWARLLVTEHRSDGVQPAYDLTQQEAARLRPALGLKTIRFLTRTGRVPSLARGRQRLVLLSDLDAYVARCRAQGVALGKISDVSSLCDRRRGARDPEAPRTDAEAVRRVRRRPTQHRRPLGAG